MGYSLQPHSAFKAPTGPVVLIILDGVGIGKNDESNAVYKAQTPFLDSLKNYPTYTQLKAHGTAVGMPTDADMGNSEVGHNTIGAGRVFDQGSALVKQAIKSKSLFKSQTWKQGINNCLSNNSTLHLIGLLSDGNVHNHIDYQLSILQQAAGNGIKKIRLHCLLDGRDVESRSALTYIKVLNKTIDALQQSGIDIKIASGGGRMTTTMDRYDADWSMVERGYNAHVHGIGNHFNSIEEAVNHAYETSSVTDQYIEPFVIVNNNGPVGLIKDSDTVFLTNFRGDRAIEISQALEATTFTKFTRNDHPNIFFAGMMQYDGDLQLPKHFLVAPPKIKGSLSTYLCQQQLKTFAISETQKYGHVTYFWNGNKSGFINKDIETYIEIPSDNIPFDRKPKMKALEITAKAIELLDTHSYQFGRINFPNGDMVGHTGNFEATVTTMETVDKCTQQLVDKIISLNGIAIVTADHGNADEMFTIKDGKKEIKTAHSLNPVPFCIIDSSAKQTYTLQLHNTPGLANIAATICNLLGFQAPNDYEPSLIDVS